MRVNCRALSVSLLLLSVVAGCNSRRVHERRSNQLHPNLPPSVVNQAAPSVDTVKAFAEAGILSVAYRTRPLVTTKKFQAYAATKPKDFLTQQALAEAYAGCAHRLQDNDPSQAATLYLAAAQTAYPWMLRFPAKQIPLMAGLYNVSTSKIVALRNQLNTTTPTNALGKSFSLRVDRSSKGNQVNPEIFDTIQSADNFKIEELRERTRQVGIGAPLVAHTVNPAPEEHSHLPIGGLYQAITAILTFPTQHQAELSFYDVQDSDRIRLGSKEHLLSADFSVPWAKQLDSDPNNRPIISMIFPQRSLQYTGLSFTEPYRNDEIPVVLVHGLASNGATWSNSLNELMANRDIRERFQFWLYQYPTGYPFIYPAKEMRAALQEIQSHYQSQAKPGTLDRMVLVGHSMGGLVSSSQIRQTNADTWSTFFRRPIDKLAISESTKEQLRSHLYLKPSGAIRRVVFVSVPHRGSTIADGWVGRLFAKLIKLPNNLLQLNVTGILQDLTDAGMSMIDLAPNSITRLQYYNPLLKTLSEMPVDPRVTCHTIAGDRGLGNAPNSSDGVVSYESSHLDFAVSEKIIPAWHSSHNHPEAIAEIRRILLEHIGKTEQDR